MNEKALFPIRSGMSFLGAITGFPEGEDIGIPGRIKTCGGFG